MNHSFDQNINISTQQGFVEHHVPNKHLTIFSFSEMYSS